MAYIHMTENELSIELINRGENGKERKTKEWISNGYLKIGRASYDSFRSKVEQYYKVIDISGRGKKRVYTLEEKESIDIRVLNYKGDTETFEDELIKEYTFNSIVNRNSTLRSSSNYWITSLNLNPFGHMTDKDSLSICKELNKHYSEFSNQIELKGLNILNDFKLKSLQQSKRLFKSAINKLEKEKRIEVVECYLSDSHNVVDNETVSKVNAYINDLLDVIGISRHKYNMMCNGVSYSKELNEHINSLVLKEFGFEYLYKATTIKVLDKTIRMNIDPNDYIKVFNDRLLHSNLKLQTKNINTLIGIRLRFPYLHTLFIMSYFTDEYVDRFVLELDRLKYRFNDKNN